MGQFEASVILPGARDKAFDYLRRPANLLKMFPSNTAGKLSIKMPEVMEVGELIEFQIKAMGNQFEFVHEVTQVVPSERIVLQQIQGPFKAWVQEQHFADSDGGNTLLTSIVRFDPPGGMLGFVVTRKLVMTQLKQWVGRGHELIRQEMQVSEIG
jgi:ligand-binding SRPBCC domain-containing protein